MEVSCQKVFLEHTETLKFHRRIAEARCYIVFEPLAAIFSYLLLFIYFFIYLFYLFICLLNTKYNAYNVQACYNLFSPTDHTVILLEERLDIPQGKSSRKSDSFIRLLICLLIYLLFA